MSIEEWKEFFKSKKSVLLLFVLTIVGSTLYVVYLKKTGQLSKQMLEHYVIQEEMSFEMKHLLWVFMGYLKKCLLVWFLGGVNFLIPLSFLLAFLYTFSYGFSITALYVSFGLQGIEISIFTFALQGILMISYLTFLESHILKRLQIFKEGGQKNYMLFGVVGLGVAFLMTLVEILMLKLF